MNTVKGIKDTVELNNGVHMPRLGFGVYQTRPGEEVVRSVKWALEAGYRSIDTAAAYGNEAGVGEAIRQSGLAREDLFVTTKVWNSDQGFESALRAFEQSRLNLGLDVIDLYLIHWPVKGKYKETWRALEKLLQDGYVRSIGVSNFHVQHLDDLLQNSEAVPAVNQVELHPLLNQADLRSYSRDKGIQMEAWSPLIQGHLEFPVIMFLADKYKKTPAQIVLRWDLQHGLVTIPKSVTKQRIEENTDIFDFVLSTKDMQLLDSMNQNVRLGPDPDNFNF